MGGFLGLQKAHITLAACHKLNPPKQLPTLKWERATTVWVILRKHSMYLKKQIEKKKSGPYGQWIFQQTSACAGRGPQNRMD